MKIWEKGYTLDEAVEAYTVGEDHLLDAALVVYDCQGSIAHARMLQRMGILNRRELKRLVAELEAIERLAREGRFPISRGDEDCHTAIENHLIRTLGEAGMKIHTARSRNDQVLTALRLYYKDLLESCRERMDRLITALRRFARKYGKIELPGYTHTRKAMPSSIGMWATAFIDSMKDDARLIRVARDLVDQSPLGTAAGYGVPLPLDRPLTARLLGFARVQENPIYTQFSRGKFESTMLHAFGQVMFDLNKLSCDLILLSMPEFGYFELPLEFCTGSSIMPQKRNPDVLELVRGNYHVVVSCEHQIQGLSANLPSGYNRDIQLSKGPTIKAADLTLRSLEVIALLVGRLGVDPDRCREGLTEEVYATQRAYDLVKKGVPFREAYRTVARERRGKRG
jgi:argininosuccinate lyase